MNRPRGLCWACYYTPAVSALYPSVSKFATHASKNRAAELAGRFDQREGLSDAEVLALPAPAIGDEDTPAPGPYTPEPLPPKVGDWCDQWARSAGQGYDLHPDTSPEAIRAAQLADVRAAVAELGPAATAEEIGEAVCLPAWNVKRLLGEL